MEGTEKRCPCGRIATDLKLESCDQCAAELRSQLASAFKGDTAAAENYAEHARAVDPGDCPVEDIPGMIAELHELARSRKMTALQSMAWSISIGAVYLATKELQVDDDIRKFMGSSAELAADIYLGSLGAPSMKDLRKVRKHHAYSFRVLWRFRGEHAVVTLFAGKEGCTRGNAGTLTLARGEWAQLMSMLISAGVEVDRASDDEEGGRS